MIFFYTNITRIHEIVTHFTLHFLCKISFCVTYFLIY